jgi:hypothetical protein
VLSHPVSALSARRLTLLIALAFAAAPGTFACSGAVSRFGPTSATSRAHLEQLLDALALRFSPIRRDARLQKVRPKYVRYALSPSRIFDDSSIWTGSAPNARSLTVVGADDGAGYTLSVRAQPEPPTTLGDTRAVMSVRRVLPSVFHWDSRNELAAGRIGAAELIEGIAASLAAFEGSSEQQTRAEYRARLPRATVALGRLLSLDTLRTRAFPDGATAVTLGISIHPERISDELPNFSKYLVKYLEPGRYRIALVDRSGARWLEATAARYRLYFALRVTDGMLAPLDAPPRPLPDTLLLRGEFFLKAGIFTVGVTDLLGELMPVRREHAKGFAMRFREEPDWHFPLAAEHLISGSLRRPFEGNGITFSLIAEDSPDSPTLLARELGITVQESAIIRWLGRFGATAMGDVTAKVEEERDRFIGEAFRALQSDVRALLPETSAASSP